MKGQSLIELALCLPVVMILALGSVALVQIEDAQSGLDAATQAAAATAARAPDQATAVNAAQARFAAVIAAYPVTSTTLTMTVPAFARGTPITATAGGYVDLGWAAVPGLPPRLFLRSTVAEPLQSWRSHT